MVTRLQILRLECGLSTASKTDLAKIVKNPGHLRGRGFFVA